MPIGKKISLTASLILIFGICISITEAVVPPLLFINTPPIQLLDTTINLSISLIPFSVAVLLGGSALSYLIFIFLEGYGKIVGAHEYYIEVCKRNLEKQEQATEEQDEQ